MIQANSVVQENGVRTGLDWVKRKPPHPGYIGGQMNCMILYLTVPINTVSVPYLNYRT
jgi:hypothetical protein